MKFINAITLFILTILIIFLMFITCSKTLISKRNISNFISNTNILDIDVNLLFNQEESGITLKDKIISLAVENKIPEEIIDDILESQQINNFLGDFFNQTINYIVNGGNKPQILIQTIDDMKSVAVNSLDYHINIMIEHEQLELYIENYCNSITNIVPDRNKIISDMPIDIMNALLNFNVYYLYSLISLILLLISILNKSWYKFIKYLGISMLISGILFVLIGSLEYFVSNLLIDKIILMQEFISPIITNLFTIYFKSGVLVSFSSIFLILIYLTIDKMVKTN